MTDTPSTTALNATTLTGALWPSNADNRLWRAAGLIIAGSLLMTVSAQIQVPFWPVPITMQTFAVMLIGMTYGWRLAGSSIGFYLAQGAIGLPVFAGGASAAALIGPTAGYLYGFAVGGMVMGWLSERGFDRHPLTAAVAMLAGTAVVFLMGATWLAYVLGDLGKAIELGVVPFLLGDACKIALGAALLPWAWHLLGRRRV